MSRASENMSKAPPIPRGSSRFEVRVQMTGPAHHPYRWEIINDDSGQVVQMSDEQFRKPRQAWEAGSAAIKLFQEAASCQQDTAPATDTARHCGT